MAMSSFARTVIPYVLTLFAFFVLLEQLSYLCKKSHLPGPVLALFSDTSPFWFLRSRLASFTPLGLSANYLIGRFIFFICYTHLSHLIFSDVRPNAFHLVVHPFSKKLFGDHNLMGQDHKDLPHRIAPNFTPSALSTYSSLQQFIILDHLKSGLIRSSSSPPRQGLFDQNEETCIFPQSTASLQVTIDPFIRFSVSLRQESDVLGIFTRFLQFVSLIVGHMTSQGPEDYLKTTTRGFTMRPCRPSVLDCG